MVVGIASWTWGRDGREWTAVLTRSIINRERVDFPEAGTPAMPTINLPSGVMLRVRECEWFVGP